MTQPEVRLSAQVRLLHDLRKELAIANDAIAELERHAQEYPIYAYRTHWRELVEAQEAAVRAQAIREYQETGDKAPSPGIGIRVREVLEPDPMGPF